MHGGELAELACRSNGLWPAMPAVPALHPRVDDVTLPSLPSQSQVLDLPALVVLWHPLLGLCLRSLPARPPHFQPSAAQLPSIPRSHVYQRPPPVTPSSLPTGPVRHGRKWQNVTHLTVSTHVRLVAQTTLTRDLVFALADDDARASKRRAAAGTGQRRTTNTHRHCSRAHKPTCRRQVSMAALLDKLPLTRTARPPVAFAATNNMARRIQFRCAEDTTL